MTAVVNAGRDLKCILSMTVEEMTVVVSANRCGSFSKPLPAGKQALTPQGIAHTHCRAPVSLGSMQDAA